MSEPPDEDVTLTLAGGPATTVVPVPVSVAEGSVEEASTVSSPVSLLYRALVMVTASTTGMVLVVTGWSLALTMVTDSGLVPV